MFSLNFNEINSVIGDITTARRYFKAKGKYLFKSKCKADTREYWTAAYNDKV